jgi:hypothetical protein
MRYDSTINTEAIRAIHERQRPSPRGPTQAPAGTHARARHIRARTHTYARAPVSATHAPERDGEGAVEEQQHAQQVPRLPQQSFDRTRRHTAAAACSGVANSRISLAHRPHIPRAQAAYPSCTGRISLVHRPHIPRAQAAYPSRTGRISLAHRLHIPRAQAAYPSRTGSVSLAHREHRSPASYRVHWGRKERQMKSTNHERWRV